MRLIAAAVLLLCLPLAAPQAAYALEIERVNKFQVGLSGSIEPGDFSKVEAYMFQPEKGGADIETVYLNSPGGNLTEAIRIGKLLRELLITTVVETHDTVGKVECSSACIFIFAGGIQRSVWWAGSNLPVVRLHGSDQESQGIPEAQSESSKQYENGGNEARTYLTEMGIADGLIERILKPSPGTTDLLQGSELRTLNWMEPSYQNKLLAECGVLTPEEQEKYTALLLAGALNQEHPLFKKQDGIESCRYTLRYEDRLTAFMNHSGAATEQTP